MTKRCVFPMVAALFALPREMMEDWRVAEALMK